MQTDERLQHADTGGGGGGVGGTRRRGGGAEGGDMARAGGGGDMDELDGLIDQVARANDVSVDPAHILPHVRASPCPVHNHHAPSNHSPGLDPRYTTSCHAGKVASSALSGLPGKPGKASNGSSNKNSRPPASFPILHLGHHHQQHHQRGKTVSRSDGATRDVELTGQIKDDLKARKGLDPLLNPVAGRHLKDAALLSPRGAGGRVPDSLLSPRGIRPQMMLSRPEPQRRLPARLPGEMATRDVVLSWLQYGSAPPGESHFPDLTSRPSPRPVDRPPNPSAVSE